MRNLLVMNSSKKIILFDLENTLINAWDDPRPMEVMIPLIPEWIHNEKPFKAGLFSFAVWHDKDLNTFNNKMREDVERVFDIEFDDDLIFLRDELLSTFRNILHMPFLDSDDLHSFFNKSMIVQQLWEHEWVHKFEETELILLDDTVHDMTMKCNKSTLRLVNPWTIVL